MSKLLVILKAIGTYRTALFPAVIGLIAAVASLLGRHLDVGPILGVVDATGLLATALSPIVGAAMDAKNAEVKAALSATASALNENAEQLNKVTAKGVVAAKVAIDPVIVPATATAGVLAISPSPRVIVAPAAPPTTVQTPVLLTTPSGTATFTSSTTTISPAVKPRKRRPALSRVEGKRGKRGKRGKKRK